MQPHADNPARDVTPPPTGEKSRRLNVARRRCAGLSLLELLLALIGTAFIATAVAAMLDAVAYGSQTQKHLTELVPRHRLLSARLTDTIGSARRVLEITADSVVLWGEDRNDNQAVETDELCWIIYDADADTLTCYSAIDGFGVSVGSSPNYELIRVALLLFDQLDIATLSHELSTLAFTADSAAPNTELITWRATFTLYNQSDTQVYATGVGGEG